MNACSEFLYIVHYGIWLLGSLFASEAWKYGLTKWLGWQVADRGYYQLKPEYWKEFDPLFAHYYLNELEDAEVGVFLFHYGG